MRWRIRTIAWFRILSESVAIASCRRQTLPNCWELLSKRCRSLNVPAPTHVSHACAIGALVGHVAEVDSGQLERGVWIVMASTLPATPTRGASVTYVAANVKRTDLALAG